MAVGIARPVAACLLPSPRSMPRRSPTADPSGLVTGKEVPSRQESGRGESLHRERSADKPTEELEMKRLENWRSNRQTERRRSMAAMAILAVALLLGSEAALAQQQAGNVFGTVTDDQDSRLPGVTVTLSGAGAPIIQVTDERGQFRFPGLGPGRYQVSAQLEGFSAVDRSEEHTSGLQSPCNHVCRLLLE